MQTKEKKKEKQTNKAKHVYESKLSLLLEFITLLPLQHTGVLAIFSNIKVQNHFRDLFL
jgi:hypothetical protein